MLINGNVDISNETASSAPVVFHIERPCGGRLDGSIGKTVPTKKRAVHSACVLTAKGRKGGGLVGEGGGECGRKTLAPVIMLLWRDEAAGRRSLPSNGRAIQLGQEAARRQRVVIQFNDECHICRCCLGL